MKLNILPHGYIGKPSAILLRKIGNGAHLRRRKVASRYARTHHEITIFSGTLRVDAVPAKERFIIWRDRFFGFTVTINVCQYVKPVLAFFNLFDIHKSCFPTGNADSMSALPVKIS